jgi:hypothetical protein
MQVSIAMSVRKPMCTANRRAVRVKRIYAPAPMSWSKPRHFDSFKVLSGVSLGLVLSWGCGTSDGGPGGSGGASSGGDSTSAGGAASSGGAPSGGAGNESGGATTGGAASGGSDPSGTGGGSGGGGSKACNEGTKLTTRLPCLLSETGLFEADMVTLGEGVHPFEPQFKLWTDSAEKRRWIQLPPNTKIDTSDMDYWSFPVGTKVWKEFSRDGVRVETRLIEKQKSGSWYTVAYHWQEDLKEAIAVPDGLENASGTPHDVPDADACLTCHSQQPDKVLGFSAIQLSHAPATDDPLEWTLERLITLDLLTEPPAAPPSFSWDELDRDMFGYLHANCGTCHNPKGSANSQTGLDMWLKIADLSAPVTESSVYKNLYNVNIQWLDDAPPAEKRVAPGDFENSAIYQRFVNKEADFAMPPLGTEVVDPDGERLMKEWIAAH